jgi:Enoyl-CoA hydratase/isomerase
MAASQRRKRVFPGDALSTRFPHSTERYVCGVAGINGRRERVQALVAGDYGLPLHSSEAKSAASLRAYRAREEREVRIDCDLDYPGLSDGDWETLMGVATLETGTTDLLAALDEGVLTLTLNRPDARNAMSQAMNQALARQLAAAALDPNVKCIVLTGAGKGFCAGGDVKGMAARGDGGDPRRGYP